MGVVSPYGKGRAWPPRRRIRRSFEGRVGSKEQQEKSKKKKTPVKAKSKRAKTPPPKKSAKKKATPAKSAKKKKEKAKKSPAPKKPAKSGAKKKAASTRKSRSKTPEKKILEAPVEVAKAPPAASPGPDAVATNDDTLGGMDGESMRLWAALAVGTGVHIWLESGGKAQVTDLAGEDVTFWASRAASAFAPIVCFAALSMNPNSGLNIPKWVSIALVWLSAGAITDQLGVAQDFRVVSMGCSIAAYLALVVGFSAPGDRYEEGGNTSPNLITGAVVMSMAYAVYYSAQDGLEKDDQLRMLQIVSLVAAFIALWCSVDRFAKESVDIRSTAAIPHLMGIAGCLLFIAAMELDFGVFNEALGPAISIREEICDICRTLASGALAVGSLMICGSYP